MVIYKRCDYIGCFVQQRKRVLHCVCLRLSSYGTFQSTRSFTSTFSSLPLRFVHYFKSSYYRLNAGRYTYVPESAVMELIFFHPDCSHVAVHTCLLLARCTISSSCRTKLSWCLLLTRPVEVILGFQHLFLILCTMNLSGRYHTQHGLSVCGHIHIYTFASLTFPVL